MSCTTRWQCCLVVLMTAAAGACATNPAPAAAGGEVATVNPGFTVDRSLATQGSQVYRDKGCNICHSVGQGRMAGPDLAGVTERRQLDWLRKFLLSTDEVLDTDPIGQALLKEYRNQRMPNMRLTKEQTEALLHYLQQKTADVRASAPTGDEVLVSR